VIAPGGYRHRRASCSKTKGGSVSSMEDADFHVDRLWTFEDVAKFLALSEEHVRRMVCQRRIPSIKIGRARRFDPGEIRAWVQSHEERPKDESSSG